MAIMLLKKPVAFWLDAHRSRTIPAGEEIDTTDIREDGRVRVRWAESNEGMGFGMVDEVELQVATSTSI